MYMSTLICACVMVISFSLSLSFTQLHMKESDTKEYNEQDD